MVEQSRILIVDDEEGMRLGMQRVLQRRGYRADLAENGERALELLEYRRYDLALVDLKMPGIDGFQVTDRINERYAERTLVVIVSALATVEAAVDVTRRGAFGFLVKPFAPDDLMQVVNRALAQRTLISERDRYLLALNRERTSSRQLINALREGLVVLNIKKQPVLMNPRAEFMLGVTYAEEMTLSDLPLGPAVLRAVDRVLGSDGDPPETKLLRLEGGESVFSVRVAPYIREETLGGALVILNDITEQWNSEQDKNSFILMVARELQKPLEAILGAVSRILSGDLDGREDEVQALLSGCKHSGEALIDLIQELVHLGGSEGRTPEKSIEELDLISVLRDQLALFFTQAERRSIRLGFESEEDECPVLADRGDLDRIFINLITNGIKYNRDGGTLRIRLCRRNGRFRVSFSDTGYGMSEEEMRPLFSDFYRIKNEWTELIPGTGVGLATVRRVLNDYNGTVTAASVPGEGSVFTVDFPGA